MKDETILYDAASVSFCLLNHTAGFLWERLEQPRSIDELAAEVSRAYQIDDTRTAEQQIGSILAELAQLAFLASDVEPHSGTGTEAQELQQHADARPSYEPPRLRVMDESEVLAAFQITSAGISWWVM